MVHSVSVKFHNYFVEIIVDVVIGNELCLIISVYGYYHYGIKGCCYCIRKNCTYTIKIGIDGVSCSVGWKLRGLCFIII